MMGLQAPTLEEAVEGDVCGKEAYRAYLQRIIDDEFRSEKQRSLETRQQNLRKEKRENRKNILTCQKWLIVYLT